ncbi:T9SS type A sorting domain-containing protein [Cryomorpha ignava]|uniref:T9SS type A sorting domain-containing protein n=1 Tax=Cryomorpha ignava TaxID=101383 RepID=A0A7K3WW38_9FLAO|nr:T9SS type A sorting domain-containing protein [Cryomorpha ignava]NEN24815.1 T9SS type A sorting domain-containing protein [Cryomorpha ignava]
MKNFTNFPLPASRFPLPASRYPLPATRYPLIAILILFLMVGFNSLYSQSVTELNCEVLIDSTGSKSSSRGLKDSENGWYLPASGTIKILIVFAEAQYSPSSLDPDYTGSPNWPVNNIPTWASKLVDKTVLPSPQGVLTRYFKEASSGQLNIIGDYLQAPTNNGVFTVSSTNVNVANSELVAEVNSMMNGNFLTSGGVITPGTFDNWTNAPFFGEPKITPSTDSPSSYDHVMIIWRNHNLYNGGNGRMSNGSYGVLVGYPSDTYTQFGSSGGKIPANIARHEFAHCILGGNEFHSSGGGAQTNYWIAAAGGYGLLSGAGSSLLTWNGWDRYRLGWKNTANTNLISARNASGTEVSGDLDATNSAHAGIYVLRDFVVTGDAVRIKLPFLNPATEYQQYLWLENHRGLVNNSNEFDKFIYQNSSCVDPMEWGLTAALQIDKEIKTGSTAFGGYSEYVRQISADGMWERSFDPPILDQCLPPSWNNYPRPATKLRENPLSGRSDLDRASIDFGNDGALVYIDQTTVSADKVNGVFEYKLFGNGNPRQLFTATGTNLIAIGTNPTSAARMNQAGLNGVQGSKNVRSIYLNGVRVEILDMLPNGDIKIKVDFDHVEIENDVTWMAPDIVLNEITSSSGYSLVVKSGNTLTLDHGTVATRMVGTETFEGDDVFTSPTVMRVKANATVNLENGSTLVIDRMSKLSMEPNSQIDIQNGAVLKIKRDAVLDIQNDAVVNVMNGGKIIIEKAGGSYGAGGLYFAKDARINLNGTNSLIDVNGLIAIGEDATFRLSDLTNATKTSGKIKFQGGFDNSVEIIAGDKAAVNIKGYSKTQEVIINLKSVLEFPDNLIDFDIRDLRISQGYADRISPPYSNTCTIKFNNVLVTNITGGYDNYGIKLYGQKYVSISNSTFQGCAFGVNSLSFELGNNLAVSKSDFNDCKMGIFTNGKGGLLRDVNFYNCGVGWEAWNTSASSDIRRTTGKHTAHDNIIYEGGTTLVVSNSIFQDAERGITATKATLKATCNKVQNHSQYGIYGNLNASLLFNQSFGNNSFNDNKRTINLYKANSLDLYRGWNDLRPVTTGTQDIINGSFICSGPTTISAINNKWKSNGTSPNTNDYYVVRDCSPSFQITIVDPNPINVMFVCEYPEIQPNGGRPAWAVDNNLNDSNTLEPLNSYDVNDYNNEGDVIGNEVLAVECDTLIQKLQDGNIFDYINISETDDISELIPLNEFVNEKISNYYSLVDIINSSNSNEELGNTIYGNGITELFSTFVEMNSVSDSLAGLTSQDLEDLFASIQSVLDNSIISFPESSDYLFGLHLSKAQAYRIYGDYVSAISEIVIAQSYASDESQIDYAERVNCMFNAESIMVANPGKDEWPDEYSSCDYLLLADEYSVNENMLNPLSELEKMVSITAQPNPTSNLVLITAIDTESEIRGIDVFDTYGRKVSSSNSTNGRTIEMSGLPNGVYLIHVRFLDGAIATTKILKTE